MKRTHALALITATASLPLAALAPSLASAAGPAVHSAQPAPADAHPATPAIHRLASSRGAAHLFAGAKPAAASPITAKWLPKGCKLVEIGPANAGYTAAQMCTLPKGYHLRRGYMLVRGSVKPSVHTSSGASG